MWQFFGVGEWSILAFLLTHPVWDVTFPVLIIINNSQHFYSHIPCGMWQTYIALVKSSKRFLLTHPVWDVTSLLFIYLKPFKFLLTHPVWDVTFSESPMHAILLISTHTSRVGCDSCYTCSPASPFKFLLTHPVWDVTVTFCSAKRSKEFLLTHPVWDVTDRKLCRWCTEKHFYSHIPCGMWPMP